MSSTRLPLIPVPSPPESKRSKSPKTQITGDQTDTTTETAATITTSGTKRMSVTLEDDVVVIRMPLQTTPIISSTGKSKLYCTTRGPRRVVRKNKDNTYAPVEFEGGVLKAIASAFVTLAPANGATKTRTIVKTKRR